MGTRSVVVALRAEMAQFKKEWADAGKVVKDAGTEMDKAGQKARKAEQDTARQATAMGRMTDRLQNHRSEWDQVGTSFLRTGAVIGLGVGMIAKSAIEWESAWTGVTKTVSGTPAQMNELEASLRGLAQTMPQTHAEIAGVAEAAGQLGIARQDVAAFTKTMIMLGDTTNLTSQESATSMAQLMNVMQTAPGRVDNLGAALVALGNNGASTEREILGMAQRLASAGEIVGFTEEEVLGLANAMASTGIEVEAGGSAMSNVLITMSKAVSTGSKDLDVFANVAGTTAKEFAAKWKADPASALADFTEGLGHMADSGKDVFSVLDTLGLSDVRVTRALLNMANSGDLLRNSFDLSAEAARKNTALTDEAAKRYDTTAARSKIAWNNIKDSAIDAGQAMLPVISGVADAVSGLAQAFGDIPGPLQEFGGMAAATAAAALLVMGGMMKLTSAIAENRIAMAALQIQAPRTAGALTTMGKAAGTVTALITGLAFAHQFLEEDRTGSVKKYTAAILAQGQGGKKAAANLDDLFKVRNTNWAGITGGSREINGMADALKALDKGWVSNVGNFASSLFGTWDTDADLATAAFEKADAALASLVSSGATQEAADGFQNFVEQAKEAGVSQAELTRLFPEYKDAVAGVKTEAKLAGTEVDKFGNKVGEMTPEAKAAADALAALKQSTHDTAMSFLDFGANLDTAEMGLGDYIKSLEDSARAQADWAENVIKATGKGLDPEFIKGLMEQGPEGAARLAELADASEEEIARINAAFHSLDDTGRTLGELINEIPPMVLTQFDIAGDKGAVEKVAALGRQYEMTPDEVATIMRAFDFASGDIKRVIDLMNNADDKEAKPKITASSNAKAVAAAAQKFIDAIRDRTVYVTTVSRTQAQTAAINRGRGATGGKVPAGFAGGGKVPGTPPADPLVDNVMAYSPSGDNSFLVRSGEWIINEEQSRINDKWLALINGGLNLDDLFGAQRFTGGGKPGDMSAWEASFQAAANSYTHTTPGAQASNGGNSGGVQTLSVDLKGMKVSLDKDGFGTFVDGKVRVGIASAGRHAAATNRGKGR